MTASCSGVPCDFLKRSATALLRSRSEEDSGPDAQPGTRMPAPSAAAPVRNLRRDISSPPDWLLVACQSSPPGPPQVSYATRGTPSRCYSIRLLSNMQWAAFARNLERD